MKIAIYHNLPSGGGKRALFEITRQLSDRHTIDVYTLSCAEQQFCDIRPFAARHIITPFHPRPLARRPFGRLNQGIRTVDLLRVRNTQRHIAQQLDAAAYDVVFAHNCQFMQSPSVLAYANTPSAYYCAEPPRLIYEPRLVRPYNTFSSGQRAVNLVDPLPRLYRSVLAHLDRENVRAATTVLTNSSFSRESLYRCYGIFAQAAYLGVDAARFRPLALPKENFVLSVGMINPHKGFDFLIRSLALIAVGQRPRLVIVSNGADERERSYLQALAQELHVDVSYRTLVTDEELVQLYNQARMTVYAPVMEPFGFVPLESMACSTAIIGVREGGVRESIIPGETGLLVERDPRAMADAIATLLANPAEAARLGGNGRSVVDEKWTWAKSVEAMEQQLAQVATSKNLTSLTQP